jgi:hypothetical protein
MFPLAAGTATFGVVLAVIAGLLSSRAVRCYRAPAGAARDATTYAASASIPVGSL